MSQIVCYFRDPNQGLHSSGRPAPCGKCGTPSKTEYTELHQCQNPQCGKIACAVHSVLLGHLRLCLYCYGAQKDSLHQHILNFFVPS